jgi:peptidoglycan/xylan/chitin deacetylase (PgdA/CDA1 family)
MPDSTLRRDARRSSERVPVLLYHSISSRPDPRIERYSMPFDRFRAQMRAVAESGRDACTFAQLVDAYKRTDGARGERVCVTFDDGWVDNRAAAELLSELGIPGTIFVASDYLGEAGMLTATDLVAIADLPGIEIAAHSVTHPRLDELPNAEFELEIRDGKDALEQLLGRPIVTFAYPFGAHDQRVRAAVIDAGFTGAAAVKNAISHWDDDPFAVARWSVEKKHDDELVRRIVDGEGAPLAWSGERIRTRGYRSYRRARKRVLS